MTRCAVLAIAFALIAVPAYGSGGQITGTDAAAGVTQPDLGSRYVTRAVPGGTLVMAIERRGGEIIASRFLPRSLVVGAVAYDGSGTGLAPRGGTLVLGSPANGSPHRRRNDFVVVEIGQLRLVDRFRLPGDFALDAVSPDGKVLYFIQRLSDIRFAVRAYDLAQKRLRPAPVVDPAEADEPMQGLPVSRAMSSDGRWAYTLYDGAGQHPFIHALDTERARAKSIDLDMLAKRADLFDMRLRVRGDGTVLVRDGSERRVLAIDPRTFALRTARPAAPEESSRAWFGVAVVLAAALAVAARVRLS